MVCGYVEYYGFDFLEDRLSVEVLEWLIMCGSCLGWVVY